MFGGGGAVSLMDAASASSLERLPMRYRRPTALLWHPIRSGFVGVLLSEGSLLSHPTNSFEWKGARRMAVAQTGRRAIDPAVLDFAGHYRQQFLDRWLVGNLEERVEGRRGHLRRQVLKGVEEAVDGRRKAVKRTSKCCLSTSAAGYAASRWS